MAPEVMTRQNHTCSVDYFAVGVIAYECMFGRRPYLGKSRKEIRDHILSKQVQIKDKDVPLGWSLEAADFINKVRRPFFTSGSVDDRKKAGEPTGASKWNPSDQEPRLAQKLPMERTFGKENPRAIHSLERRQLRSAQHQRGVA